MRNLLKRRPRDETRPSLRERAASLKAVAARVLRRSAIDPTAEPARRAMVVGALAATAFSLPVLGARAASGPSAHPDADLVAAGERYERARIAEKEAQDARHAAWVPIEAVLATCPPSLFVTGTEKFKVLGGYCWPSRLGMNLRYVSPSIPAPAGCIQEAWTAEALRAAITKAVPLLGQGGLTPHRIRRWREQLPIAEAFDAQMDRTYANSPYRALAKAEQAAREESLEATRALYDFTASTPEGLAVLARLASRCGWAATGGIWPNLLRSAANVSGVDLTDPHAPWPNPDHD